MLRTASMLLTVATICCATTLAWTAANATPVEQSGHHATDISQASQTTRDLPAARERLLTQLPAAVAEGLRLQVAGYQRTHASDVPDALWHQWVDTACGQIGAHISGLFWHTDLDQALADADQRGVPVLSLRLLGRLDENLSCANSRFFRRVLYPNQALAERLRTEVVLHWSSERIAPRLTVDYGDGRRIETTITGNSIHYLLDHNGRVVDGLPGMVTPAAMDAFLNEAIGQLSPLDTASGSDPATNTNTGIRSRYVYPTEPHADDAAVRAQLRTMSKGAIELPLQDDLSGNVVELPYQPVIDERPVYDDTTRALIAADLERAAAAAVRRIDLDAELDRFAERVRADSASNLLLLQPQLRGWLAEQTGRPTLETTNAWVYATLFDTPADDAWLGLVDLGYTGLPDGGIATAAEAGSAGAN